MGKDFGENKRAKPRRSVPLDANGAGELGDPLSSAVLLHEEAKQDTTALSALSILCSRYDGWLRVIPGGDGKNIFLKWKFSRGKHRNSYVWWTVVDMDILGGLWGLIGKLDLVDAGHLRPTPDTPYD